MQMHSKENDSLCQSLIECRYGQAVHLQQDIFHSWSDLQGLVDPGAFLATLPREQAMQFLSSSRQTLSFPCKSHRHFSRCEIGQPNEDNLPNNDNPPDISLHGDGRNTMPRLQSMWCQTRGFWPKVFDFLGLDS